MYWALIHQHFWVDYGDLVMQHLITNYIHSLSVKFAELEVALPTALVTTQW